MYTNASTNISNLATLCYIFNRIYIKNSFNFNFILLNHLIKGILIFINSILLILNSKTTLLLYN